MSSRRDILPRETGITVTVGWDNPLMTFFAQVARNQQDDDTRDPILLWLGGAPGEITRPEDLAAPLAPYAALTQEHIDQLRADRGADADRGPSPLQRSLLGRSGLLANNDPNR